MPKNNRINPEKIIVKFKNFSMFPFFKEVLTENKFSGK